MNTNENEKGINYLCSKILKLKEKEEALKIERKQYENEYITSLNLSPSYEGTINTTTDDFKIKIVGKSKFILDKTLYNNTCWPETENNINPSDFVTFKHVIDLKKLRTCMKLYPSSYFNCITIKPTRLNIKIIEK